ncbi:MAG: 4-hydroxyphenylacetate 3-hydroxylase family protein [Gaiellales bacterium]
MATTEQASTIAARSGADFLAGLANDRDREIWIGGEKVTNPLEHDRLRSGAEAIARVYDTQLAHAEICLAPTPDDGRLVNRAHLIPRSKEDLERRRASMEIIAAATGGMMGRVPDYLNVTFACFAGARDVWARRGNEQGAENIVAYQRLMRDRDLSTTHAIMNPVADRSLPDAQQMGGEISLHKVGETSEGIVVRGARMLATLAPFADEISVYPGSPLQAGDEAYALAFALPMSTPGLRFICRDSFAKPGSTFDYPLSARFDEMDAVVVFDDVVVPHDRVFLDGDLLGYDEVITDTGWRGHIMHQAFTRAYVKLLFAFGLGHVMAETTGVVRFDHIQEKLGQLWTMAELTRCALVTCEADSYLDDHGVWYPNDRPLMALRGEMPKWLPHAHELLQLIGGGSFMATPSEADFNSPIRGDIERYFQAAGADAERRVRLFRLAWDYIGSDLGGRSELYERFYLSDSWRMTQLAYRIADKTSAVQLVEQFLED